jgi:hypothetical protein
MKFADDRGHIAGRCTGIDIKRPGKLISDFSHRELTITPVPDGPGSVVEVMNQASPTIEHHTFTVDQAHADIRPSFRALGIDAPLWMGGTTRTRLRSRVHLTINTRCPRTSVSSILVVDDLSHTLFCNLARWTLLQNPVATPPLG